MLGENVFCLTNSISTSTGVDPKSLRGSKTGVFQGSCFPEYHKDYRDAISKIHQLPNQVTLISRFFELKGPYAHFDTACASGASALNEAFHALKKGICDQAIVTGANSLFQPIYFYEMLDLKMISKDGKSKCMDASANGYARGEAVVAVFLQKKSDAKRIYATILNCKSNTDGWKPEGVTFPGQSSQSDLLRKTYSEIGLNPLDFKYIEAHTTGTAAGDPVELNAIYDVLCVDRPLHDPLLVGCLKSSIGHTEGTSGLCALVKSLLVLQHRKIPPNLHMKSPNLNIKGLEDGRMKPVTSVTEFNEDTIPINCFGFGGANVHFVIRAHKCNDAPNYICFDDTKLFPRLVPVCGRTRQAVDHLMDNLISNPSFRTREFLDLVNRFSKQQPSDFPYRAFMLIEEKNNEINCHPASVIRCEPRNCLNSTKKLCLVFKYDSNIASPLLAAPAIQARLKRSADVLGRIGVDINECIKRGTLSKKELVTINLAMQMSMIDLLKELDVPVDYFCGSGLNELACGYADGILTADQVILAANCASLSVTPEDLKNGLSRIIFRRDRRSDKWLSDSSLITNSNYFAQHILKPDESCELLYKSKIQPEECFLIEVGPWGLRKWGEKSGNSSVETLKLIGQLYTEGFPSKVEVLYPRVNYPLETTTPSLSPLIEWDHEQSYSLDTRTIELNRENTAVISPIIPFTFDQSNPEDAFLFDHRIDGRILFPATGYLAMAWYTLAQMKLKSIFQVPVKFTDVSIERATVMSPGKQVHFTCTMSDDSGSFVVKDGENVVAGGKMEVIDEFNHYLPGPQEEEKLNTLTLSLNDIYKEFRVRGYDYDPFFQGLYSALADGSHGQVVWRQIATQSALDALNVSNENEQELIWLRSWIMFADSVIQLTLLDDENVGRALLVPTKLESLTCSPKSFTRALEYGEEFQDPLTMSQGKLINCSYRKYEDVIECSGLILKGLKTSLLKRNQQMVRKKKYEFIPLDEDETLAHHEDKSNLISYHMQCLKLAKKVNKSISQLDTKIYFPLDEPKYALLKVLANEITNKSTDQVVDLTSDLLLGANCDESYYQDRFLKPIFDLVTYNLINRTSFNKLDVLEVSSKSECNLKSVLEDLMDDSLFNDQCNINYTNLHSYEYKSGSKVPSAHLTLYNETDPDAPDKEQLFKDIYEATPNGGFLFILGRDKDINNCECYKQVKEALETHLGVKVPQFTTMDQLCPLALAAGFKLIAKKWIVRGVVPFMGILLRKIQLASDVEDIQITVDLNHYELWLSQLQELMRERQENSDCNKRLWLVPKFDDFSLKGVTGLIGFVKSLRLEPGGDFVRCLIDWSEKKQADIQSDKYRDILANDLVYNIRLDEHNGWGTYEHLQFQEEPDQSELNAIKNVYLKSLKPGDLSSLVWVESNIDKMSSLEDWVDVYYAPLNFKCVMYATGRLAVDSVHGIDPRIAQDSLLGIEFAGLDRNGNRLMGVVPYKGFSTRIPLTDNVFTLPVPESWSLEEASTVPVVYSTAMYGLVMRGQLREGESVLIHSGAGGVGLAALNICMSKKCTIYTTVGSSEKKDFLLREFPTLPKENIFYSRDTTFEESLMKATGGRGVDVVLNSLSGELLQASLRCVARNGRFIEIGKADLIADINLHSWQVDGNRSIHGVYPESFFRYNSKKESELTRRTQDERSQLQHLLIEGMKNGTVKPLIRTVFEMSRIEDAFKFMFSGKHMGKVVIKMHQVSSLAPCKVVKTTHFYPNKSYLVIGGLGGFGLEVVQWLADKGARKIVVNSRRGLRESYQKYCVQRLQLQGITLILSQADSTSEEGVKKLINLTSSLGPIGGIFNAAAVFDDMLLTDQTPATFEAVCLPKAKTTLLLDECTRKMPNLRSLNYFVTFSSISGGRGNPGQTSYNFANSIMDSLCEERRRRGLPGLSIQWGVIGDVGYVAEKSNSNNTVILGLTGQRMHSCLSSLDQFLRSKDAVVTCYVKAEKTTANDSVATADIIKVVSRILGLKDMQSLDPNSTLGSLGIDSLIAVEIQQILERIMGSTVSLKQIKEMKIQEFMQIATKSQ